MRIAYVLSRVHRYGSSRYVLETSRHFVRAGHTVHIFARTCDPIDIPGIFFHSIPTFSSHFLVREGVLSAAHTLNMLRYRKVFDITIAQPTRYFSPMVCEMQFVYREWTRWLIAHHRLPPTHVGARITPLIERHNLKRAKAVIAISRRVKQEVLKNYPFVDAGQVYVIYSGVNLQEFHPRHRKKALAIRRRFAISPDEKLLLFVGNPFGRKGLESLIRALPLLRSREYVLLVSGNDGPTPYEKLAEKLGVADRIRWNIGLTYAINQFFAASDIFVLPTRYEPFGLVILEAMASGLPPITSRIAGAAELIEDGKEGFLIKNPHNEREIANKIDRLLSDESLLVRMRKRCRKKAETYPWFRTAQLMLQVFEQVS